MPDWLFWTIGGIIAASGLTLLAWSLFKDRSRARRRCPKCWYDMSGTPTLQCPECGKTAKAEKKFFKTRRRYRLASAGIALALLGYATGLTPRFLAAGWPAIVPIPVLNFALDFAGTQAEQDAFDQLKQKSWKASSLSRWDRMLAARHSAAMIENAAPSYGLRSMSSSAKRAVQQSRSALANLGTEARVAIPSLEHTLNTAERQHSQSLALETLGSMASDCPAAVDILAHTLHKTPRLPIQRQAAEQLVSAGLEVQVAFKILAREARRNSNVDIRSTAIQLLPRIQAPDDQVAKFLTPVLMNDPESQVRSAAATVLGGLAQSGFDVSDPLSKALIEDENTTVRAACAHFLGFYSTPQAIETLAQSVRTDEENNVRFAAAKSLGRIGPDAADAVLDVLAAIEEPDQSIGPLGVVVLERIGHPSNDALVKLLDHDQLIIRRQAIASLQKMANKSMPPSPRLVLALSDEDDEIRYLTARTLGRIGETASDAIPRLIDLTKPDEPQIARLASIDALAKIKPHQPEVVQALTKLLGDPEASIRQAAATAIAQAGPSAAAAIPALEALVNNDPIAGPKAIVALRAIRANPSRSDH